MYANENALAFARASSNHLLVDYQLEFRNGLGAGGFFVLPFQLAIVLAAAQ
jgi:hypothetical protein